MVGEEKAIETNSANLDQVCPLKLCLLLKHRAIGRQRLPFSSLFWETGLAATSARHRRHCVNALQPLRSTWPTAAGASWLYRPGL